jgi:hypothetical protein
VNERALEGARRNETGDYPEHEKMKTIPEAERQAVGGFIEWLKARYELAVWGTVEEYMGSTHCDSCSPDNDCDGLDEDVLVPVSSSTRVESLLADYYGIDLQKIDAEKQMMLDGLRLRDHQREVLKKRGPRIPVPSGE